MSYLKMFNDAVGIPMQSQEVMSKRKYGKMQPSTKMGSEQASNIRFNISEDTKNKANLAAEKREAMEDKEYMQTQQAKIKLEEDMAKQQALRDAQGQFEAELDKMIAPTQEEGLSGAINKGILNTKAAFGDKMSKHALQKISAKKALEKGVVKEMSTGESLVKGSGIEGMAKDKAGEVGGKEIDKVAGGGSGAGGGAAKGALKAGLASGFNPAAMAVGATMGILQASQDRKSRNLMADAKALEAEAGSEINKARIKSKLSKSMSKTLLSGINRKVSL